MRNGETQIGHFTGGVRDHNQKIPNILKESKKIVLNTFIKCNIEYLYYQYKYDNVHGIYCSQSCSKKSRFQS